MACKGSVGPNHATYSKAEWYMYQTALKLCKKLLGYIEDVRLCKLCEHEERLEDTCFNVTASVQFNASQCTEADMCETAVWNLGRVIGNSGAHYMRVSQFAGDDADEPSIVFDYMRTRKSQVIRLSARVVFNGVFSRLYGSAADPEEGPVVKNFWEKNLDTALRGPLVLEIQPGDQVPADQESGYPEFQPGESDDVTCDTEDDDL